MTERRFRTSTNGVLVVVVLATLTLSMGTGLATASTPPLSCADGEGGVSYTAPSNLTVADASDAPVDDPFASNDSIAIGDVTVSADGDGFARVDGATDETCLSDVDATSVPVTVATDDATVTVEGNVTAFAFDNPASDDVALAYRAAAGPMLELADVGHPAGTPLEVIDADSGDVLGTATVASDGSLSLALSASPDGTRIGLQVPDTATDVRTTASPTPTTDGTPSADGGEEPPTDGFGLLPLLLLTVLAVALVATALVRRREG